MYYTRQHTRFIADSPRNRSHADAITDGRSPGSPSFLGVEYMNARVEAKNSLREGMVKTRERSEK